MLQGPVFQGNNKNLTQDLPVITNFDDVTMWILIISFCKTYSQTNSLTTIHNVRSFFQSWLPVVLCNPFELKLNSTQGTNCVLMFSQLLLKNCSDSCLLWLALASASKVVKTKVLVILQIKSLTYCTSVKASLYFPIKQ